MNAERRPTSVDLSSGRKVTIKCELWGGSFQAVPTDEMLKRTADSASAWARASALRQQRPYRPDSARAPGSRSPEASELRSPARAGARPRKQTNRRRRTISSRLGSPDVANRMNARFIVAFFGWLSIVTALLSSSRIRDQPAARTDRVVFLNQTGPLQLDALKPCQLGREIEKLRQPFVFQIGVRPSGDQLHFRRRRHRTVSP